MQADDFVRLIIHISGLMLVAILYYFTNKRIHFLAFHSFFSIVWLVLLLGSEFLEQKYRLLPFSLVVFYSAWASFFLGVLTYSSIFQLNHFKSIKSKMQYSYKTLYFITIILFFMNLIVMYDVFGNLIANGLSLSNLSSLRSNENQDYLQQSRPLFQIFGRSYLIYIPILIFLYSKKKIKLITLVFISLIAFIFSASYFTRAPVLQLFVTVCISFLIFFREDSRRITLRLTTLGILVITVLTVMQNAIQVRNENTSENLLPSLILYIFGGQKAFEDILSGNYPINISAYYTFDSLNYFLDRFGLILEYPSLVREYSAGNIFTNVYTYLDAYYLDFGFYGIIIGPFLIGLFVTHSYRYAMRHSSLFWSILYSYCVYGLLISFLNNEFIRVNTIIILLEAFIIELISRKSLSDNSKQSEDNEVVFENTMRVR
jgi:oligosaccharide repeat unit polymerase